MDYLLPIACILLVAGLIFYLGYPLFVARQQAQALFYFPHARELMERKEQLYAGIKELEFDRNTGKLAAEDYQRLRAELEDEALQVIRQLDQLNGQADSGVLQARIEAEVRTRRQQTAAANSCPSCEATRRPGDRFCSRCGARFEETN